MVFFPPNDKTEARFKLVKLFPSLGLAEVMRITLPSFLLPSSFNMYLMFVLIERYDSEIWLFGLSNTTIRL